MEGLAELKDTGRRPLDLVGGLLLPGLLGCRHPRKAGDSAGSFPDGVYRALTPLTRLALTAPAHPLEQRWTRR